MLRPLQHIFPPDAAPDLLVGLGAPDDAAVWRLDPRRALVATTDFFTPVVDEPYAYGAIAAANSLSDLYAMGATPFLALNIAAWPSDLPPEVITEILRGGAEKTRQAGAVIAGGHSIRDPEPKYGLVALGFVDPERMMTKGGARPGQLLALTKPLGTGVTTTALRSQQARPEDVERVTAWMMHLNDAAARLALDHGVRGATDVTGFGLIGHASELAQASSVGLRLYMDSIPLLAGSRGYTAGGHYPGGSADNRRHFQPGVAFGDAVGAVEQDLLFDAQTSGGLLLSVPPAAAERFAQALRDAGQAVWLIGEVIEGAGLQVVAGAHPAGGAAAEVFETPAPSGG